MNRNHFMVDIETLGTASNAPVISIAALAFTPGVREDYPLFKVSLSPNDQPGRPINFDTVCWWMKQPREASEHWVTADRTPTRAALENLSSWAHRFKGNDDSENCWWAYSPQFDYIMLEGLCQERSLKYPWSYKDLRDVRTIRPFLKDQSVVKPLIAHDPACDCMAQIEYVHRFYEEQGLV